MNKVLVAVIAYNEEEMIASTLSSLEGRGFDIIVIDDGSTDKTGNIANEMGFKVIRHPYNAGNAMNTVSTYLRYGFKKKYEVVCQFDGDGQHLVEELPKIINPVLEGKGDYVIGSRFIENEGFQSYFIRRLGIRLFSWIDSKIIGQKITDVTSGFRAYGPKVIDHLTTQHKFELCDTSQLLLVSYFAGARIMEVPVKMYPREKGVSEFGFRRSVLFPLKGIICVLGEVIQRRIF